MTNTELTINFTLSPLIYNRDTYGHLEENTYELKVRSADFPGFNFNKIRDDDLAISKFGGVMLEVIPKNQYNDYLIGSPDFHEKTLLRIIKEVVTGNAVEGTCFDVDDNLELIVTVTINNLVQVEL